MSRELRTKLHNAIGDCCFGREGTLVSWLRSPSDVEQYIYDKLAAAEDAPPAATECQCHEEESGFGPWVDRSQCPIHAQPPQAPKEQTERVPTITFDGTYYDCARCGNHQTVLCKHWQALFERAYSSIEATANPKEQTVFECRCDRTVGDNPLCPTHGPKEPGR